MSTFVSTKLTVTDESGDEVTFVRQADGDGFYFDVYLNGDDSRPVVVGPEDAQTLSEFLEID